MAMDSSRAARDTPASRASLTSASMPGKSLHWVGIHCRRSERPNTSGAPACAGVADGKRARDHDLVTPELNVLNNPSKNLTRKQHWASRRSVNNLPETMLTNAVVYSVGPATRQSYTTAHDAFVAWARTQQLPLGADHPRWRECLCVTWTRSCSQKGVSAASFGTIYCRGVPRHPTS